MPLLHLSRQFDGERGEKAAYIGKEYVKLLHWWMEAVSMFVCPFDCFITIPRFGNKMIYGVDKVIDRGVWCVRVNYVFN